MIIIVPPSITPSGVGVAQEAEKFFPVSRCCLTRVASFGASMMCAGCLATLLIITKSPQIPTSLSLDGMTGEEYASSIMLKDCISKWTGWHESLINVKVEHP